LREGAQRARPGGVGPASAREREGCVPGGHAPYGYHHSFTEIGDPRVELLGRGERDRGKDLLAVWVLDRERLARVGGLLTACSRPRAQYLPSLESGPMAGHSKWAQIKHKKATVDARRGQLFTKLARAITVAARDGGGGDPEGNAALANAIEKAKSLRMPKDNIERAIARGTGEGGDAAAIEAVTYEGYGPGGVAILVECLTDNRNRTAAEIRHRFSRADASLGEPGSVAWMFAKKGVVLVDAKRYSEDDLIAAIDAGADDVTTEGDSLQILSDPTSLRAVREALEQSGVEVQSTEQSMIAKTTVELGPDDARKLLRLLDALDDQDDVDQVHANFDIKAEVLEEVAAA
jgi:YebC/PmpR family DNA-binding regulatory protein